MPITERDRNRLATITAQLKPPNSLAFRLDTISDEQRAHYARWNTRFEQWLERCKTKHDDEIEPDARPYASMLAGHGPPKLRRNVEIALFGDTPTIPLTFSEDQAAQMWLSEVQK